MYSAYLVMNKTRFLKHLRTEIPDNHYGAYGWRSLCHHVTLNYPDNKPAPLIKTAYVKGFYAYNGIEACRVEIDGSCYRPDGLMFHLTIAIRNDRTPAQANDMMKETFLVKPLDKPFKLEVEAVLLN